MTCEICEIYQGDNKEITTDIAFDCDGSYDLTNVTAIKVRFAITGGGYIEKKFPSGGVTIVSALAGKIKISVTAADSAQFLVGNKQDFYGILTDSVLGEQTFVASKSLTVLARPF